jgi:hypothetical protein
MSTKKLLGESDKGRGGSPGSSYTDRIAKVYELKPGRFSLYVRAAHGSNQGYCQEHGRIEREFRAGSVEELLRVGVSEIRGDAEFDAETGAQLVAAIREACFAAEDAPETEAS